MAVDTELQYARIFVRTPTFRVWQSYCSLRDYYAYRIGLSGAVPERKQSVDNLKKYVLPSKVFRLWRSVYSYRQALFLTGKKLLPTPLKRQLKQLYTIIFAHKQNQISRSVLRAWAAYAGRRLDTSLDIINFGVTTYDYRFQRPQQLAHALGRKHCRVFYIESEFSYAPTPQFAHIKVRAVGDNVFVVKVAAPRDYFIYQDRLTEAGRQVIMASLKRLFAAAQIINPVAKLDHPFWQPLTESLCMPTVYDAMDLHTGFQETGHETDRAEAKLVAEADCVLVSSDYLARTFRAVREKVLLLKNAGDYTHFGARQGRAPADLAALPGRIIGYYGAIAEWFDVGIVRAVLRAYPHDSVVLIGRVQNQEVAALQKEFANLHLLGEKPYRELPRYLHHFDVALIPFLLTPLIQATNPVKIYEYFAAGKPCVATKIPEIVPYQDLLYFASTQSQFVAQVGRALAEHSTALVTGRRTLAAQETWEARAATLHTRLLELFPPISVIVLTYNNAHLTRLTLESVLEQSRYPNLEVVVVDNHSDEATVQLLQRYRKRPGVRIRFNTTNRGFAAGNNQGMKLARGAYFVLLNNDTQVTPGWAERLLRHLERTKGGLVGPVTNNIGNESKIMIRYNPEHRADLEQAARRYTYAHWGESQKLARIAAFCWMLPRSLYEQLGGLDEQFGQGLFEDDDYCQRVRRAGYSIWCVEDSFVHHYGGGATVWDSPKYKALFARNRALYEAKWGPWHPHQYRKGVT